MWFLGILAAYGADIAGAYTLASTPAEVKASIDDGINASIRDLPPMFRGTARSRLEKVADVCDRYTFQLDEQALTWQCDGKAPLVFDRASFGTAVPMERDGKRVRATVVVEGDRVHVRFDGDDGHRTATFTFEDGGMRARSTVKGSQLAVPFRWETTYARETPTTP